MENWEIEKLLEETEKNLKTAIVKQELKRNLTVDELKQLEELEKLSEEELEKLMEEENEEYLTETEMEKLLLMKRREELKYDKSMLKADLWSSRVCRFRWGALATLVGTLALVPCFGLASAFGFGIAAGVVSGKATVATRDVISEYRESLLEPYTTALEQGEISQIEYFTIQSQLEQISDEQIITYILDNGSETQLQMLNYAQEQSTKADNYSKVAGVGAVVAAAGAVCCVPIMNVVDYVSDVPDWDPEFDPKYISRLKNGIERKNEEIEECEEGLYNLTGKTF